MAELFEITTPTKVYRYTDAKQIKRVGGFDWTPVSGGIQRSDWKRRLESQKVTVTFAIGVAPWDEWAGALTAQTYSVRILDGLTGDTLVDAKVLAVHFRLQQGKLDVITESTRILTSGHVPPFAYSSTCQFRLGEASTCGILLDTGSTVGGIPYKTTINFDDVTESADGLTLTATALGAPMTAGFLTMGSATLGAETILITGHAAASNQVTLNTKFVKKSGSSLVLIRACDKALATCKAVFDNDANFGGHPFAPRQNPSQGLT